MNIQVFGPGCTKCEEAKKLVEKVVQEQNITATVTKVSDFKDMMRLGILSTPAIAIDGIVKCTGRVPSASELMGWLSTPDAHVIVPTAASNGCTCCGKGV